MHRKFVSPQTNDLEWLQASYDKRKNRSIELGVKAIDTLIKVGKTVSYRTVSDKSKEIDPDGLYIKIQSERIKSFIIIFFSTVLLRLIGLAKGHTRP